MTHSRLRWLAALPLVALLCAPGNTALVIADEGTPQSVNRPTLNFVGTNVSCADNPGGNRTDCTVSGLGAGNNSFGVIGNAIADVPTDTLTVTDGTSIDFTTTDGPEDLTAEVAFTASPRLMGRTTVGAGHAEEITVAAPLTLTGLTLDVTNIATSDLTDGADFMKESHWSTGATYGVGDPYVDFSENAYHSDFADSLDSDQDDVPEMFCTGGNCGIDRNEDGKFEIAARAVSDVIIDANSDGLTDFRVGATTTSFFGGLSTNITYTTTGTPAVTGNGFRSMMSGEFCSGKSSFYGAPSATGGNSACISRNDTVDALHNDPDADAQSVGGPEASGSVTGTTNSEAFLVDPQRRTSADISTTATAGAGVEVVSGANGLKLDLDWPGAYRVEYSLLTQTSAAGTGIGFGVNYTGTYTSIYCTRTLLDETTTDGTGVGDDVTAVGPVAGQVMQGWATATVSTTTPNLGPNIGYTTTNVNQETIVCNLLTTGAGDVVLWFDSETGSSVTVKANSFARAHAFP